MNARWKLWLPLTLIGVMVASTLIVGAASATHPRPKGATPLRVSLAVAYKACASPNRQHGAPLATLSCNPPVQASSRLTVGTGDAWAGTTPKSVGSVRIDVKTSSPEDVKIVSSINDVRCTGNSTPGFCTTANTDNAGVPDYSGELNGTANIRITDHYNGPIGACGACADPATGQDLAFPVSATCAVTNTDGTIGSTCTANTTANGTVLGSVQDNKRANVEIQQINVLDGGSDGTAATTADNTLFETQGIWIP
jgi:hypothetical protein